MDELLRSGAQQMLQAAIDAEVADFLREHAGRRDEHGNRLVVRNGYHPERELLTGAGRLEVRQPRVRDNTAEKENRVAFSPSVLPPYLRRSKTIEDLIPWLYLKGISTGDFQEALQSLLGEDAKGLSANVVFRLKEKWGANTTNGAGAIFMERSMCISGRMAFTPMFASKMRQISGSACSF